MAETPKTISIALSPEAVELAVERALMVGRLEALLAEKDADHESHVEPISAAELRAAIRGDQ